jgi:hypothetical protein
MSDQSLVEELKQSVSNGGSSSFLTNASPVLVQTVK